MVSFDAVADEYDAARPDYPEALFDALEPLAGRVILEGGAGTGIATRGLLRHDATSHSIRCRSRGPEEGRGAHAGPPGRRRGRGDLAFPRSLRGHDLLRAVVALARRGAAVRGIGARPSRGWPVGGLVVVPVRRRRNWFDAYWDVLEATTIARRDQRDFDTGAVLRASGLFDVGDRVVMPWVREVTVDRWLIQERSNSYVAALSEHDRTSYLRDVERIIRDRFPGGHDGGPVRNQALDRDQDLKPRPLDP